jgi:hypothetical protein
MRPTNIIRLLLLFCILYFTISCDRQSKFPEGGYKYPAKLYKSIRDSFNSAYSLQHWCKSYNEQDLSNIPLDTPTFRLVYETAFGESAIFILRPYEITVKEPTQGKPYPEYDTLKLTQLERLHFKLLKRSFPIQELKSDNPKKKKADSLAKLYPVLLDPKYYKALLDKAEKPDSIAFKYSIKKIALTKSKYIQLIDLINTSGYWTLPIHIECDYDYTDGYGILLEANTKKKYNFVSIGICSEEAIAFCKACQAIIDVSNLDKKIKIISEKN